MGYKVLVVGGILMVAAFFFRSGVIRNEQTPGGKHSRTGKGLAKTEVSVPAGKNARQRQFLDVFSDGGLAKDDWEELVTLREVFQSYLLEVKSDYRRPLGDNRDFVKLLSGGNPAGLVFIPPDHPRINDEGELVDRRGIPFVIHPLSATSLEIRAAGEDRTIWTDDDLVLVPPGKSSGKQ